MLELKCDCEKFVCQIQHFPEQALGRIYCYCDDCQSYLHYLKRPELLDAAGGTELCPVYPKNFKIVAGSGELVCTRLKAKGLFRWSVKCCNTPIANTIPGFPWIGLYHRMYQRTDPKFLETKTGPAKVRILGRFATSTPPAGTSQKATLKDILAIAPYVLRGLISGKGKGSPFFLQGTKTPVVEPYVLSSEERKQALAAASGVQTPWN